MFDINLRLISILGLLTIVVTAGLLLDYFFIGRLRWRLGLVVALIGIAVGTVLTISAVLPDSAVYGHVVTKADTNRKIVAITFDDGPYPPYTNQILDILKEYNVPATFFVVGKNVRRHPELVQRIAAEGHQIGNHTYNHIDLLKADNKTIIEEIEMTDQAIHEVTGQHPTVFRPPHGFRDAAVMQLVRKMNMKVIEWSVISRDWTNPGIKTIVERTLVKVRHGSVLLLHDGAGIKQRDSRAQTVEATRLIVRDLLQQGYQFVTVNEILKENGDINENGRGVR